MADRTNMASLLRVGALVLLCAAAPAAPQAPKQTLFPTPDAAVAALVAALDTPAALTRSQEAEKEMARLVAILGPESVKLVASGDPYADQASRRQFVDAFNAAHRLETVGDGRMVVHVGSDDWPLPIPLVREAAGWRFDAKAGAQIIVDRRIGRNEIAAIRTLLAAVDAEGEFAKANGGAFSQFVVSSPGKRDGLYWPQEPGQPDSPLEALISQAEDEGYPGEIERGKQIPYHGYYFRILTSQGPYAPGGVKQYITNGRMTGGFALVAWPASYGASGIMTFQINQEGIVFQKDLRGKTPTEAGLTRFDPDLSWTRIDVTDE